MIVGPDDAHIKLDVWSSSYLRLKVCCEFFLSIIRYIIKLQGILFWLKDDHIINYWM